MPFFEGDFFFFFLRLLQLLEIDGHARDGAVRADPLHDGRPDQRVHIAEVAGEEHADPVALEAVELARINVAEAAESRAVAAYVREPRGAAIQGAHAAEHRPAVAALARERFVGNLRQLNLGGGLGIGMGER
jgi:hypothetical protein